MRSLWIILIGFLISLYFGDQIFAVIRQPILPYLPQGGLVFTHPTEKFLAYLKVSFLSGAIITCPFWLYQVWWFIAPGLYKHEKKMALKFIFFGSLLFISGVVFVYKVIYPFAFKYLLTFGSGVDKPMITIREYLSFFILTTVMFGMAFEMPLILVVLAMLGIIDGKILKDRWRTAVFILAIVAATFAPPDAVSMMALLLPLLLLYGISIIAVDRVAKKRANT